MEYTLKDVKKIIKDKGFIPLDFEWNGYDSYIDFEDKYGYRYSQKWSTFNRDDINDFKPIYFGHNKYSFYNMHIYIKNNGYECMIAQDYPPKDCYEKIKFIGKCGHIFERNWTKFIQKNTSKEYCPKCYRKLKPHRDYIKIDKYYDLFSQYNYNILENLNDGKKRKNDTKILVEDKNGYKGYLTYANLSSRKEQCRFLPFHKTNKWSANNIKKYFKDNNIDVELITEQYNGYDIPLKFRCSCGEIFERIFPQNRTPYKCQKCLNSMSNYEIIVEDFLKKNNISYVRQKRFKDCKYKRELPFDFYLNELNICIEVQGEQHYMAIIFGNYNFEKADKIFEETIIRDKIKEDYCEKNKIPLIEIKYNSIKDGSYKDILNKLFQTEIFQGKSQQVARGLNTVASRIAKNEDALKKYGVSINDANGNLRSTFDILSDLKPKWDEMENSEKVALGTTLAGY